MQKISQHISYNEAIRSETAKRLGIDNTPNANQLANMVAVAENVFEPMRVHFNVPIYISSFFRSIELNRAIGGAKLSQHLADNGAAIDVDADIYGKITNRQIFDYIRKSLVFDQLIAENLSVDGTGGWIHFSYKKSGNRQEVLVMNMVNGKAVYEKYENSLAT